MLQFIYGSEESFAALEDKAKTSCVRFSNQLMPPGTVPERATIGFEVDPHSGLVRLLVDRAATYDGSSSEVRSWLATGIKTFEGFVQLRSWLGSTLRDAFRMTTTNADQHPGDTDTLNRLADDLDDVGVKGFRIAMRLGCRMNDLPS